MFLGGINMEHWLMGWLSNICFPEDSSNLISKLLLRNAFDQLPPVYWKPLTIVTKSFLLEIWQSSQYVSERGLFGTHPNIYDEAIFEDVG